MIFNMGGGGVVPKYNRDAEIITPGTLDQVIPTGTYMRGDLTILGDENLIPENIKEGKNIFGVEGIFGVATNVWKKSELVQPEVTVTNPSITFTSQAYDKQQPIQANNFDLTKVSDWRTFFNGFKNNFVSMDNLATWFRITYLSWSGEITNFSANTPTNGEFIFSEAKAINQTLTFTGEKILQPSIFSPVGFVVDDNASAYPNGAVHTDGYYYELLGHVDSVNVMSLSDDAVDAVANQIVSEV